MFAHGMLMTLGGVCGTDIVITSHVKHIRYDWIQNYMMKRYIQTMLHSVKKDMLEFEIAVTSRLGTVYFHTRAMYIYIVFLVSVV